MNYLRSFVGSGSSPLGGSRHNGNGSNSNLLAVIMIGLFGFSTVLGYYFINKKRVYK